MNLTVGYLFALATILLFGSWAVPTNRISVPPRVLAFWLTVGHLILSLYLFIFFSQQITPFQMVYPFIAGVLWAVGIVAGFMSIKELGITRALGTWIPIVIVTSALWGFFFFGEAFQLGTIRLFVSFGAILLLAMAAVAVILSAKNDTGKMGNVKTGFIGALILGVTHGSFFVPLRSSDAGFMAAFLPLTIGMVITTAIVVTLSKEKITHNLPTTLRMLSGGLILGAGNYTATLTTVYLGVVQGYPLTQLAIIINTLWGILYFKEVATKRGKVLIVTGIILALLGAIILNQARVSS